MTKKLCNILSLASLIIAAFLLFFELAFKEPGDILMPDYPLPLFEDSALTKDSGLHLPPGKAYQVMESEYRVLDTSAFFAFRNILRYTQTYRIQSGEKPLWCSPNLVIGQEAPGEPPRIMPCYPPDSRFPPLIFLAFAVLFFIVGKKEEAKFDWANKTYFYAFFLLIFLIGVLSNFYINAPHLIYSSGDPEQFIQIAREWMSFQRTTPIPSSVGTAFFYMPFLYAFDGHCFLDVAWAFSIFTLILTGMGGLVLTLFIAEKLGGTRALQITGWLAALFPVCAIIVRAGDVKEAEFMGRTLLSPFLGSSNPYAMKLFNRGFLTGWNGMADNYAVFLILAGIAIMFAMRASVLKYLLMGLLLGFALSVRYGVVALIPAVVIYELSRLLSDGTGFKKTLGFMLFFAAFGFLGFFPQLLDNYMVNGEFLKPTALPNLYDGEKTTVNLFGLHNIKFGLHFFLQVHFKILLFFGAALYFIKDRKLALFLWGWVFLTLLFHSSLNFYNHSELRYIITIFPAVFIAAGLSLALLGKTDLGLTALTLIIVSAIAVPEASSSTIWLAQHPLPLWLNRGIPLLIGGLLFCLGFLGIIRRGLGFVLAVLMVLLATGTWLTALLLMGVYPLYWLVLTFKTILDKEGLVQEPERSHADA